MTRIYAAICALALFGLTMNGCAWFEKHPVIPAVVTCSGETIPAALVLQVYNDAMTDNWFDLVTNIVPLLKDGYADIECIWGYLKVSNPETAPHIKAMQAKHAAEFKGSVSVKDSNAIPGDRLPGATVGRMDPARAPAAAKFSYFGENVGARATECDVACGSRKSLAPPSGCLCQVGSGRSAHWIAAR